MAERWKEHPLPPGSTALVGEGATAMDSTAMCETGIHGNGLSGEVKAHRPSTPSKLGVNT